MCWARAQTRYMLGDSGPSYLVGFGKDYSKFAQVMGASCPGTPFQGKAQVSRHAGPQNHCTCSPACNLCSLVR